MIGAFFGLIGLIVIVVAIVAAVAVMIYNGLVGLRNRVQNAWSQIDVQLKRRHDLIAAALPTFRQSLIRALP